ncbi:MAG TPA: hypothetical protein VEK15_08630 [Vicinamibacteria bacterium]|nr:hypothetical protein [Vicinamibacteria bacterium]
MRSALKVGGGLFAVLVVAVAVLALFVHFGHPPTFEQGKIDLTVEVTPERVARGKVLAAATWIR